MRPFVLMINGPFGVGKTSVAEEVVRREPGSRLFDPEIVGFAMRRVLPMPRSKDFQDHRLWAPLAALAARLSPRGPLVVPMTLTDARNLRILREGLGRLGPLTYICLTASADVLRQRLAERGHGPGSWPEQQIARCVAAFAHPEFGPTLATDDRSVSDLATEILATVQRSSAR